MHEAALTLGGIPGQIQAVPTRDSHRKSDRALARPDSAVRGPRNQGREPPRAGNTLAIPLLDIDPGAANGYTLAAYTEVFKGLYVDIYL